MSTGIARDLSAKLQGKLAEVLERELRIAGHVLGPPELGEIMIEAAVMLARTSAASIAGFAGHQGDASALFKATLKAIVTSIETGTGEALERALKEMESRG